MKKFLRTRHVVTDTVFTINDMWLKLTKIYDEVNALKAELDEVKTSQSVFSIHLSEMKNIIIEKYNQSFAGAPCCKQLGMFAPPLQNP